MPLSPTQLSLRYLRRSGYNCAVSEYWFQPPGAAHGRRKDLYGFVDVCAAGHGELLLVQTTSRSNLMARVRKITDDCRSQALELLAVPGVSIHVHGWPPGERKRPVIYTLSMADFEHDQELPF